MADNKGLLSYNDYKVAGYSDSDIQNFMRPKLEEAGYSKTEVNQYFYQQSGDARLSFLGLEPNKNVRDMAKAVADMQYKASLEGKNLDVVDAIKLGWQQSVTGMLSRGELPTELTEEQAKTLNFFERAVMGASSIISDIPVYFAGSKAGAAGAGAIGAAVGTVAPGIGTAIGGATGAAVGGTIGAFGFHAAARQALVDMYSKGEVASWDELLDRIGSASKEFAKGAAIGLATAGAAKVGAVAKNAMMGSTMARAQTAAGNVVNITARTMPIGSEILGLTTASSLVEGRVPTAQDFIDSGVLIAGMRGMSFVSDFGKNKLKNKAIDYLYDRFVKEGKGPLETVKDIQSNPKILENIVKDSGESASKKRFAPRIATMPKGEEVDVLAKAVPGYTPIPRPKGRAVLPKDEQVAIDNAVKRSDIFNKLADAASIPVRLGKIGMPGAIGIYKPKGEVIRIRQAKDISTLSHEVAHHFEKLAFGKPGSKEMGKYYDELNTIATEPAGVATKENVAGEGFAEFISKYILNPKQAKKVAPKFYEVFEKEIGPKVPELFKALKEVREDINKYYSQPYAYEVLSNISNRPTEAKTPREKWEQIKYNFVRNWLDDKNPIKYAVQQLENKTGVKLGFLDNAYFLSRMFPGWTGKAEAFIEHKPFEYTTLKDLNDVKSLREIVNGVKNWDEFTAYLVSARALELNARGIETGIDMFAAKATERQLKSKYRKAAEELYKYQDSLLKYQLDSGLISKETYSNIKKENKKYVPFQRVVDKAVGSALGSKTMSSKQTLKGIKGSTRDIILPLESIIRNTFETVQAVERNRVGLAYADLSKLDKSGEFVERIPLPKENLYLPKDASEIAGAQILNTAKFDKANEILVYRNGQPELYRVDPDVAKVINGSQNNIQKIEALNFMKPFTQALRVGATGLNLTFAIKNLIRDNLLAYMSSKSGYKPFVNSIENAKIAITKDTAYWELLKAGGSQSSFVSIDRNALQKSISDLSETGYFNKIWNRAKQVYDSAGKLQYKETLDNINLLLDRVLDLPALISETSELSTRIGEFRAAMKGKDWTKENIEKAGYDSREVTLDFAKGGIYGKAINQFKAFFNANLLGAEKAVDILTNKKSAAKVMWMLGTLGTMTALANYDWENGQEDQDIKEVLQVQKDTNWVLKVWGTDTIVRIPKPQQVGFISTMFEQLTTDVLNGMNKQEREDIINNLFQAFVREINIPTTWGDVGQTLSPTMMTPIVENFANRSMYFDTPIVPTYAENALPEYQYTDRTTELTKAISRTLGMFVGKRNTISPAKLENLVRGWSGGVGTYLMNVVDLTARKAGIVPDPPKPKDTLADIPFVRAFIVRHPSGGSQSVNTWYNEFAKRQEYLKAYEISGKKFDTATMEQLSKYQIYKNLQPISRSLSQVSAQIRTINALPDMSPDEKRQNIDALYITKIGIAQQGLKMIKEMDEIISKGTSKK